MQNNRSRIVIIAIILATFAAGALVWYLAKPSTDTPVDVALEDPQSQDGVFNPEQVPDIAVDTTPPPVAQEQQPVLAPQVAAAVNPSAPSGTTETVLALIALAAIGGAVGLYRFTTI